MENLNIRNNSLRQTREENSIIEFDLKSFMKIKNNKTKEIVKNNKNAGNVGYIINRSDGWTLLESELNSSDEKIIKNAQETFKKKIQNLFNQYGDSLENTKGKVYCGLYTFTYAINGITYRKVIVNNDIQKACYEEMLTCDIDDLKNQRKICKDIGDFHRYYGEGTIDEYKTFIGVNTLFLEEKVKAAMTIKAVNPAYNFNVDKLKDENYEYKIKFNGKCQLNLKDEIGKITEYEGWNKEKLYIFNDFSNKLRSNLFILLERFINKRVREDLKEINVSVDTLEYFMKKYSYSTIVGLKKQFFERYGRFYQKKIEKLNELKKNTELTDNEILDATDDINDQFDQEIAKLNEELDVYVRQNKITYEEMGEQLYAATFFTYDKNELKPKNCSNKFFSFVGQKYFTAYNLSKSNKDFAYERLYGDTHYLHQLTVGDTVEIINGAVKGFNGCVTTNSKYNGNAIVYADEKRNLFVKLSIKEFVYNQINEQAQDSQQFSVTIYNNSYIDKKELLQNHQIVFCKDYNFLYQLLTQADITFCFKPNHQVVIAGIPQKPYKNLLLANINGKQIPVASYFCCSNELQNMYAGVSFKSSDATVTINNDGYMTITYFEDSRTSVSEDALLDYDIFVNQLRSSKEDTINVLSEEAALNPMTAVGNEKSSDADFAFSDFVDDSDDDSFELLMD